MTGKGADKDFLRRAFGPRDDALRRKAAALAQGLSEKEITVLLSTARTLAINRVGKAREAGLPPSAAVLTLLIAAGLAQQEER